MYKLLVSGIFLLLTLTYACKKDKAEPKYYVVVELDGIRYEREYLSIATYGTSNLPNEFNTATTRLIRAQYVPSLDTNALYLELHLKKDRATDFTPVSLYFGSYHPNGHNVNATFIDTVQDLALTVDVLYATKGSIDNPGIIEGSFSGSVKISRELNVEPREIVPINGRFLIPHVVFE